VAKAMAGVNLAIHWLYKHLGDPIGDTGNKEYILTRGKDKCAVCGMPEVTGPPPDKVLRPTFVDHSLLLRNGGNVVCDACQWYLGAQDVRRTSWFLTEDKAVVLATPGARLEVLELLARHVRDGVPADSYYLITESKRKHVALRARLNHAGARVLRVNFETMLVDVDRDFFRLYRDVCTLRQYHAWREIESDAYLPFAILKWPNLTEFELTRMRVWPQVYSPQYRLAKFLYHPDAVKEVLDGLQV
jgi:hypothetical protein